jgi:hypothetical protein
MFVYWIHHKDHTDAYSQGYVGISVGAIQRWREHKSKDTNPHIGNAIKKYGWDNLTKKVIFTGSLEACLKLENLLRPSEHIGWNISIGGNKPGKLFKGYLQIGNKNPNFKYSILATNLQTGKSKVFTGRKELEEAGFSQGNAWAVIYGKYKQHKGHTFVKINN